MAILLTTGFVTDFYLAMRLSLAECASPFDKNLIFIQKKIKKGSASRGGEVNAMKKGSEKGKKQAADGEQEERVDKEKETSRVEERCLIVVI